MRIARSCARVLIQPGGVGPRTLHFRLGPGVCLHLGRASAGSVFGGDTAREAGPHAGEVPLGGGVAGGTRLC